MLVMAGWRAASLFGYCEKLSSLPGQMGRMQSRLGGTGLAMVQLSTFSGRFSGFTACSQSSSGPHLGPIYAPPGPAGSHSPGLQLPTGSWATCAKPCGLETLPLSVLDTPSSAHIPLLTLAYLPTALDYSILKRPWTRRHLLCGVCPWIVGSLCHCHVPRLEYQTDDAADMPCSIHASLFHMSMIR